MNLTALIVDDEPLARLRIRNFLLEEADIEIAGESDNGADAVEQILSNRPDIVFLDIQMPEASGLEVLQAISGQLMPSVIMTTAFDDSVIQALDLEALDYLLKPFDKSRFSAALRKARARALYGSTARLGQQVNSLLDQLQSRKQLATRLLVRVAGRLVFVNTTDIDWISADKNYAHLHVGKHRYTLRETLNSLELRLDPEIFIRIHRSTIVNINRIKELHSEFKGDYLVVLEDGTRLNSSRTYRQRLRNIARTAS